MKKLWPDLWWNWKGLISVWSQIIQSGVLQKQKFIALWRLARIICLLENNGKWCQFSEDRRRLLLFLCWTVTTSLNWRLLHEREDLDFVFRKLKRINHFEWLNFIESNWSWANRFFYSCKSRDRHVSRKIWPKGVGKWKGDLDGWAVGIFGL